jgi:hypothetical protein
MELIEDSSKVQTRFSREGGEDFDSFEDAALAERLLKKMTLNDIGFDNIHDDDDCDDDFSQLDFDNVDEVVDFKDLEDEFGSQHGASADRNSKLLSSSAGDFAYDYNKHFKPMTKGATYFVPGVGLTVDPEERDPIVPAVPDVDDVFEEDLKKDCGLAERSAKILAKVKKTVHSDISGLDVPVFESSRYKFTDDFLHPLIDGDTEGYEELEDNIFELLLQSDDEDAEYYDNDDHDDVLTRDELLAQMRGGKPTNSPGGVVDIDSNIGDLHDKSRYLSVDDFGFGDDEQEDLDQDVAITKVGVQQTKGKKGSAKSLKHLFMKKMKKNETTTTTTTSTNDSTTVLPKKSVNAKTAKKAVSFSSKSVASHGVSSKKTQTKGASKYGNALGAFSDDDDNQEETQFNPDDMFGYGDDDDQTTNKTFGYGDGDDDDEGNGNDFGYTYQDHGDEIEGFGYDDEQYINTEEDDGVGDRIMSLKVTATDDIDEDYDEDMYYYDDEDDGDEDGDDDDEAGIDAQIIAKMKKRLMAGYSPEDGVTIDIEEGCEEDDLDAYGEAEFDDLDWYYKEMMEGGEGEFDGDGYYDEDDEHFENYQNERRGQNRDQELSVIPATDAILTEQDYALFQRLVDVYELDNSSDDEEFERDRDEDDEYMFHINRDGMSLDNPIVRQILHHYQTEKSRHFKQIASRRSRLSKSTLAFIKKSINDHQNTPQGTLEDVGKEIDRQFAKKKKSRLDVQSMRTTLSTTANIPTLIKEVRVRAVKTGGKNTKIVAEVKVCGQKRDEILEDNNKIPQPEAINDDSTTSTTQIGPKKPKKSVSFGEDQIEPPKQIALDSRGIPIGVMEKHRNEREEKRLAEAAAKSFSQEPSKSAIVVKTNAKPRIQFDLSTPVAVTFVGQTQQFAQPSLDEDHDDKKSARIKDEKSQDDGDDGDDEDDDDRDEEENGEEDVYIPGARRNKKETPEERKLRKQLQKQHNAQRREGKKTTKNMFKDEVRKAKKEEMNIKFNNPVYKKLM